MQKHSYENHWLTGLSLNELKRVAEEMGLKSFAARQMADWLYRKRVAELSAMTNLSLSARERMREAGYEVGRIAHCEVQVSVDGTKK